MDKELTKEQYTETLNLIRAEVDQQIKPLSNQLKDFTDRQNQFNTKVMDAVEQVEKCLTKFQLQLNWRQALLSFGGGFCAILLGIIMERLF